MTKESNVLVDDETLIAKRKDLKSCCSCCFGLQLTLLQVLVGASHLEVGVLSPDLLLVPSTVDSLVLPSQGLAGQRLPGVFLLDQLGGPDGLQLLPGGLLDHGALLVASLSPSHRSRSLHGLQVPGLGAVGGRLTRRGVPWQGR